MLSASIEDSAYGNTRKARGKQGVMSAEEVANAFIQHFYKTFATDAQHLAGLYVSVLGAQDDPDIFGTHIVFCLFQ